MQNAVQNAVDAYNEDLYRRLQGDTASKGRALSFKYAFEF